MLRSSPAISTSVVTGASLDDSTLEEMLALRATMMSPKPPMSQRTYAVYFNEICKTSNTVILVRVPSGCVVGFMVMRIETTTWAGRRLHLLEIHYVFVHPRYRGSQKYVVRLFLQLASAKLRQPFLPLYVYGSVFLPSFLRFSDISRDVWTYADVAPVWERTLLEHLVETREKGRWDPDLGLVDMPSFPKDDEERTPRTTVSQLAMDRYLAANPRWLEGYCLPILGRFRIRDMAADVLSRALRRR